MIVVDTNILAYLYLPTAFSEQAERLLLQQPRWIAPVLWRSEFRNVLALYLRKGILSLEQAYGIQTEAETLLAGGEYDVPSLDVLRLIETSKCSAYDCEFVALAKKNNAVLVTEDKKIRKQFPEITLSLAEAITQQ
ncbi:MAG: type II toxin-antitoxin system VapC family toxin [Cellvibrionales bacterium]|jgi:predicted nucleic acid-binding protein|nr:type II toxin-antitoxin system VapC family toxin [Cellvibrionales bacterium]MBK8676184.1 type II toxin-antitoxin system VapC family toxin [Cellvibrionales bacterium]